ncbi:hypothetical protein BDV93DRAFT_528996 [Ceratobasidium sp. AG-I]|nr:hypothetical protein BDV93DRAFT_528996 [Ceratobasidium sp. AG-I]
MTSYVPGRSTKGCLTCKQRKKKCDEAKPICFRCANANILCEGYGAPKPRAAPRRRERRTNVETTAIRQEGSFSGTYSNTSWEVSWGSVSLSTTVPLLPDLGLTSENEWGNSLALQRSNQQHINPPTRPLFDPTEFAKCLPFIIEQCSRMSQGMFRPFPYKQGIIWRVHNSEITRWTMYVGSRINKSMIDGNDLRHYIGWVDRLHRLITSSAPVQSLAVSDLRVRISGLAELTTYAFLLSTNAIGYSLFKTTTPYVLQFASTIPHLWSPNSSIYILHMLKSDAYEIRFFPFVDTICALAFGVLPILQYDTAFHRPERKTENPMLLEWVNGCPTEVVVLLARINAVRAARLIGSTNGTGDGEREGDEWKKIEETMKNWSPTVEQVDGSDNSIMRLAIQESWRHAVYVYLYMGMCSATSEDPRVQTAVKQIVKLAGTVEPGAHFEHYFFLPCLIAGVAARHEPHRALLRQKIYSSRDGNVWTLRGPEFIPVLDRLWHGVGRGGRAVTWEDYVAARAEVLRVDA